MSVGLQVFADLTKKKAFLAVFLSLLIFLLALTTPDIRKNTETPTNLTWEQTPLPGRNSDGLTVCTLLLIASNHFLHLSQRV